MKTVVHYLGLVLLIYLAVGLLLYLKQRSFIYFPTLVVNSSSLEQVVFLNENIRLKSYIINPGRTKAIIYFGGNAESVSDNVPDFDQWFPDHTVYLPVYRGYEASEGEPTEAGLFSDATVVFDAIQDKYQTISVIGRSLGSGVASYLAANRPVHKMVLVTPYDSVKNVAQNRFLIYPMALLLKDKFETNQRVKDISAQTLIILAEQDNVVKPRFGRALADIFPQHQLQLLEVAGSDHTSVSHTQIYQQQLTEFLN